MGGYNITKISKGNDFLQLKPDTTKNSQLMTLHSVAVHCKALEQIISMTRVAAACCSHACCAFVNIFDAKCVWNTEFCILLQNEWPTIRRKCLEIGNFAFFVKVSVECQSCTYLTHVKMLISWSNFACYACVNVHSNNHAEIYMCYVSLQSANINNQWQSCCSMQRLHVIL